jgi:hypothetical protein
MTTMTVLIKTPELTLLQINWVIAKLKGLTPTTSTPAQTLAALRETGNYSEENLQVLERTLSTRIYIGDSHQLCPLFSTEWAAGGPIYSQLVTDGLQLIARDKEWSTTAEFPFKATFDNWESASYGKTPLDTALRCYIAREFGDALLIPADLIEVLAVPVLPETYFSKFKAALLLKGFTDDEGASCGDYGFLLSHQSRTVVMAWCYPTAWGGARSKLVVRGLVENGTKQNTFYFENAPSFEKALADALAYITIRVDEGKQVIEEGDGITPLDLS